MPNLSLKNLPKELHRRVNGEIIACLQEALLPRRIDPDEAAERIRAFRTRFRGPPITDEELARARGEGRP
jgi:hypothetical protein